MIEVVYVLERVLRLGRGTIAATIRTLLAEGSLEPDRDHWADVIGVYEGHPKLSVTDVHLALRARAAGTELFTFQSEPEPGCWGYLWRPWHGPGPGSALTHLRRRWDYGSPRERVRVAVQPAGDTLSVANAWAPLGDD